MTSWVWPAPAARRYHHRSPSRLLAGREKDVNRWIVRHREIARPAFVFRIGGRFRHFRRSYSFRPRSAVGPELDLLAAFGGKDKIGKEKTGAKRFHNTLMPDSLNIQMI